MNFNQSTTHELDFLPDDFPDFVVPMSTKRTHRRRIPNIQFRVLVIGRANAGKTSILQRVCDTTGSPTIYHRGMYGQRVVRGSKFYMRVY